MKESIFNIHTETEGHKLLFNSLFCGLCEIDDTYYDVLDKVNSEKELSEEESLLLKEAMTAGFVVEDNFDEIEYLRVNKYKVKFNDEQLSITIAPTLACNFQCIYCYEDSKSGAMTEEIENRIAEYVEKRAEKLRRLKITWYGGEPLLVRQVILRLSQKLIDICKLHNIDYDASIITNGSLLQAEDKEFFKSCHISSIQITLDGPAEIHNNRRICKSIDNNFDVIVKNINLIFDEKIAVKIRVNVDKENIHEVERLLKFLSDSLISKNVNIGFAPVQACTDACASVAENCYDIKEFSHKYFELYEFVQKYGFDMGTKLRYARPRINYCGADVYSAFVVDANGYLYKCWHDVGDAMRSIGHVENIDAALLSDKASKWIFSDALQNDECRKCKVLPLCMGGCPSMNFYNSREFTCQEAKYNISEVLVKNYYKSLREEKME